MRKERVLAGNLWCLVHKERVSALCIRVGFWPVINDALSIRGGFGPLIFDDLSIRGGFWPVIYNDLSIRGGVWPVIYNDLSTRGEFWPVMYDAMLCPPEKWPIFDGYSWHFSVSFLFFFFNRLLEVFSKDTSLTDSAIDLYYIFHSFFVIIVHWLHHIHILYIPSIVCDYRSLTPSYTYSIYSIHCLRLSFTDSIIYI